MSIRRPNSRPSGSRTRIFRTCQVLRPRRTFEALVMTSGTTAFRGSTAGLYAPQPTLRLLPRGRRRTARGLDVDRYSFILSDLIRLLLAGLRRTMDAPPTACGRRAGRQDCPKSGDDGAEDRAQEGDLDIGRRHPIILQRSQSLGMAGRFVEHRIGDKRIVRLIQKWLKAGVLDEGIVTVEEKGTR